MDTLYGALEKIFHMTSGERVDVQSEEDCSYEKNCNELPF